MPCVKAGKSFENAGGFSKNVLNGDSGVRFLCSTVVTIPDLSLAACEAERSRRLRCPAVAKTREVND